MADERLTVIVLTFRRPDDLRTALPMLLEAIDDHPNAELLVVDNDVIPSAEAAASGLGDKRLRYVHEPRPGIAAARNRGLDETADSALVVFIDDDERPGPGWLGLLVDTQRATGAAAVAGPVTSAFDGELDPWIVAGRFFERRRHLTGTEVPVAATNNLLLDRAFVGRSGLRFDEEFGLSGGSDSVFTRALVRAGGRIVWCDEAGVVDVVPASRANRGWVKRRAFRMGNTEARALIHVAKGPEVVGQRMRAFVRGVARMSAGAVQWAAGRATGSVAKDARGQRTFLRGAGMASAAVGIRYFEYRRPKEPSTAAGAGTTRVLESFRAPSGTTNPYVTQLFDSLRSTEGLSVQPFSWRRALLERWDVFHVHWPETTWASADPVRRGVKQLLFGLLLLRILVTRAGVVQTYHNVASHEGQGRFASLLLAGLRRLTTSYIALNDTSKPPGRRPCAVIPHGHYRDWYARFAASDPVPGRVATFGMIRPYKGIEDLIGAFSAWDDPEVSLVIGGRASDADTAARISALAAADHRVDVTLRFLTEQDVVTLVTQSQLMVFPYLEMHNSGAVLAALSLARPVLVPRNGANEALAREVGPGWVRLYSGRITPAILAEALDAARSITPAERPDLSRRGWVSAGTDHRAVFWAAAARRN